MWGRELFPKHISILALAMAVVCPAISSAQAYRPGEVIVKLKGTTKSLTATSFLGKVQLEKSMKLESSWKGLNIHHFKATSGQTTQQLMDLYRDDPSVEYVEPNYLVNKKDVEGSAEESQEETTASSGSFTQNSAAIGVEDSWDLLSSGKSKVVVAVIDTGVDYNHTVFTEADAIWTNTAELNGTAGVDDDGNGFVDDIRGWNFVEDSNDPMDDNNHGTHVAGIVLGVTQDIRNTSPLDDSILQIMPLKFLDGSGSGATTDAIKAIQYAVNNGAKVINNSWGGGSYSAALHEALSAAYEGQTFVTAAAGNESSNNNVVPTYPANYDVPNLASIASTTDLDLLSSFSNFGSTTVHIGSPGSSILSTFPNNTFGRSSGTSMAAPLVAGIAAMILYERPTMTGYQAKEIILAQSESQSSLAEKTTTKSRVNAHLALASAMGVEISGQPDYDIAVDQFSRDLASSMDGGSCGLVRSSTSDGPLPPLYVLLLVTLLVAPLFVARFLSKNTVNRRKHERFEIDSDVSLSLGGRRMNGRVSSISQGGLQLDTEEMLEQGSVISMTIRNPKGEGEIKVEGHIVWSEEQKHYGVQFLETAAETSASISKLTSQLKPEDD